MKKHFAILLVLCSLHSFSQSVIYPPVDSKEYEQMKQGNQIPQNLNIANPRPFTPTLEDFKRLGGVHQTTASVGCSCYITPDGSYTLAMAPNDDGSTNLLNIPFNFCLYGTNYNSLYINNNGNISFGSAYSTFSSNPFPDPNFIMVAPFWGDVDTRGIGTVQYKITSTAMYINWVGVGYFNQQTDKVNTFQLIITNGTDPILPAGNNIAFCYGDMQWTTGSASQGVNGFGGVPATVGINQGTGNNYIQIGRFDHAGLDYDGGYGNNDGVDWLDNKTFYFNSCNSTNIAPIASGLNNCDTIRMCGIGDTLILNGLFLAPEIGQNTTVLVNLNGTPNTSILNITNGNSATAQVQIIGTPANAGVHVITFTATDNGIPVGTTIVNVHVFVDTTGISNFNPSISGNLEFCQGSNTTLTVNPTTYDSYYWKNGATATSITVDSTGTYWVTASKNGCHKTTFAHVTEHPLPTPVISGYPYACNGGVTHLIVDSLIYASYHWSNGSINDSIVVGAGTYTVSVTDAFGCTATSPPITVTAPVPPVITGIVAVCNGANAVLTTTHPFVSYNWSNSSTNDSIFVPTGTYTVTVTDINGCSMTSAPFVVSMFNYSLALSGVQHYCTNQNITLSASANPSANAGYLWSTTATTASIIVNHGGNYTVTVSYPNGCTKDTTVVVPAPYPLPTPAIIGTLTTCKNTPTVLSIDSTSLYTNYNWSNSNTTSTISVISGTFTVTVTDPHGCIGISPPVTVVNSNPTVTISGAHQFCPGDTLTLTAHPVFPVGASYVWSTTATTSSISINGPGTYYVDVNYSNACNTSDTVTVTQFVSPVANFTESPLNTSSPTDPITFADLSTVSSGTITNWNWNFNDGNTSSLQHPPPHTYNIDGVYTVILAVQSSNGCWDTITHQYTIKSELKIPNIFSPNGDGVNDLLVFKNLQYFPETSLVIYDRWGIKVYESSDYQNNWNGGGQSDGVYFFLLTGAKLKKQESGFVEIVR